MMVAMKDKPIQNQQLVYLIMFVCYKCLGKRTNELEFD